MSSIDDIREIKDFKQISFSGFKKQDVVKELNYAFDNCLIESAIYWCGELVCSGNFKFLWENIISYMSVSINILNPKLPIFMQNRFNVFKTIINSGYLDRELHLRNHNTIRQLFSEICLNYHFQHNSFEYDESNRKFYYFLLFISHMKE